MYDTVDGSEIRRLPVEVGSLSHYLPGFSTVPGGSLGFLNHQQYLEELKEHIFRVFLKFCFLTCCWVRTSSPKKVWF